MIFRRGLLVDAFNHCGLFPLRNYVKEHEYQKANIFKTASENNNFQQGHGDLSTLRSIVSSPRKKPNPTHIKPHSVHVTSPENRTNLKVKTTKNKKKVVVSLSKIKLHFPTDPMQPSTSKGICHVTSASVESTEKCSVCGGNWTASTVDWYQCVSCNSWACKDCFGIDMCANCA